MSEHDALLKFWHLVLLPAFLPFAAIHGALLAMERVRARGMADTYQWLENERNKL